MITAFIPREKLSATDSHIGFIKSSKDSSAKALGSINVIGIFTSYSPLAFFICFSLSAENVIVVLLPFCLTLVAPNSCCLVGSIFCHVDSKAISTSLSNSNLESKTAFK